MSLSTMTYEAKTNSIYGSNKLLNVSVVTFSYASSKGQGRRKVATKVVISSLNGIQAHFRRWAAEQGFIKPTLIEWEEFGVAWVNPRMLEGRNPLKNILSANEHLGKGIGSKYKLLAYHEKNCIFSNEVKLKKEEMHYRYETVRGIQRQYFKRIVCFNEDETLLVFEIWLKEFNEDFKYRKLLNVQILGNLSLKDAI